MPLGQLQTDLMEAVIKMVKKCVLDVNESLKTKLGKHFIELQKAGEFDKILALILEHDIEAEILYKELRLCDICDGKTKTKGVKVTTFDGERYYNADYDYYFELPVCHFYEYDARIDLKEFDKRLRQRIVEHVLTADKEQLASEFAIAAGIFMRSDIRHSGYCVPVHENYKKIKDKAYFILDFELRCCEDHNNNEDIDKAAIKKIQQSLNTFGGLAELGDVEFNIRTQMTGRYYREYMNW